MNNTIKNYIKEIEQKRQNMVIENSIIKKRFALVESFDSLFSEIKYLNKQSFDSNNINENLLQVLNSMFQDDGKSFMDTVKSKLSDFLVTKLGYEGFEKEVIMKAIGDTEDFSGTYLNDLPDFMKNKMADFVKDNTTKKQLEDSFVDRLCPMMGDINSKMELKLKDIRDNILS
jgi:cobalamin biosynthesis Co2+ chelatase CbiK